MPMPKLYLMNCLKWNTDQLIKASPIYDCRFRGTNLIDVGVATDYGVCFTKSVNPYYWFKIYGF